MSGKHVCIAVLFCIILVVPLRIFSKQEVENDFRYEVAICAIFRDEGRFLKEWIEYHRLLGVERFFLYDNNSQDNWQDVLQPYIDAGIVQVTPWPYESENIVVWNEIQCCAYNDCINSIRGVVKWLVCLDVDEFIVLKKSKDIKRWLRHFRNYGAVALNWQMFGTSGVHRIPADKLLIETLLWRGKSDSGVNKHVKCIVRPEHVKLYNNPHFAILNKPWFAVDTEKAQVTWAVAEKINTRRAVIHHYWTRDIDYLVNVKLARRRRWGDHMPIDKFITIFQDEKDEVLIKYADRLRKVMSSDVIGE